MTNPQNNDQIDQCSVQCPACQTRFAVPRDSIEEYEYPRFHCSRCDNIFGIDETGLAQEFDAEESYEENSGQETEINTEPVEAVSDISQMNFDFDEEVGDEPPKKGFISGVQKTTEEQSAPDLKSQKSWFLNLSFPQLFPAKKVIKTPVMQKPDLIGYTGIAGTIQLSPGRSVLVVLFPIMIFLAGLLGISYYSRFKPLEVAVLTQKFFPALPHVAPSGLHLSFPVFRTLTLQSGEEIGVISGQLTNRSDRKFEDVVLEAVGYDQTGRVISVARVDAGSNIAGTRLKGLSSKVIDELQESRSRKQAPISPRQKREYAIVLTKDINQVKHYSTRVYSVQYVN